MTDRKKILVVEDDHFMNESLCIFLGNAGYDTLGVFDGTPTLRVSTPRAIPTSTTFEIPSRQPLMPTTVR